MVLPHAAKGAAAHSSCVDTGGRELACQSGSEGYHIELWQVLVSVLLFKAKAAAQRKVLI